MAPIITRAARAACAVAACATLAVSLSAAPVAAQHRTAPLADGSASAKAYEPYGRAYSKNYVLKKGCHNYQFRYRVRVPREYRDDWAAEIFLRKPNGRPLQSAAEISGADPLRGRDHWRICRPSTTYGSHQIRMKVTYGPGPEGEGYVHPTRFRFTRP